MTIPAVKRDFAQTFLGAACSATRMATEWMSWIESSADSHCTQLIVAAGSPEIKYRVPPVSQNTVDTYLIMCSSLEVPDLLWC